MIGDHGASVGFARRRAQLGEGIVLVVAPSLGLGSRARERNVGIDTVDEESERLVVVRAELFVFSVLSAVALLLVAVFCANARTIVSAHH